jgi:hypothetical protein
MLRNAKEEIYEWYLILEDYRESGMNSGQYCRANNLNKTKLTNMIWRIDFKKYTDPLAYQNIVNLALEYIDSGKTRLNFCKEKKIMPERLSEAVTHLKYLDTIEEMKNRQPKTKEDKMQFIPVHNPGPTMEIAEHHQEQEFIEEQNSIELTISKGIKVIVDPKVGSDKLIKIIELLKDL